MQKIIKHLSIAVSCAFLLFSCKKDLEKTVLNSGTAPTISTSPAALVLSSATAADTLETLSWTRSSYGFNAAVSYTLQVGKAGTNFVNPKEISTGNSTVVKYTGADLNQLALLRGLTAGNAGELELRIKSSLSDSLVIYSAVTKLTVTPYLVIINYPSLWVPGDYQGWDPGSAPKISSKLGNGVYEGYVNIPTGGTYQFKYTSEADWNHIIYGWASSTTTGNDVSGTFSTNGGNLFVPAAGYFLLKGNTTSSTWSATRIMSWSMIGDFNSWAGDAPMTYNVGTKQWTGTLNAPANGVFKFRANNDWPINFGDTDADLGLDYDGSNIAITAGSHEVTLDLSVPGNYTYKIL